MLTMFKKPVVVIFSALIIVLVFYFFGFFSGRHFLDSGQRCDKYKLLNPITQRHYKDTINKKGYVNLRDKIEGEIKNWENNGNASMVSVWFRDLEFGPTLGINERIDYIPASLLKLPLAMVYMDLAQDNPSLLKKTLSSRELKNGAPNQEFPPEKFIQKNTEYTIEDLINYSLMYSDNNASELLYQNLKSSYPNEDLVGNIFRDLGILGVGTDVNLASVNTKEYSSIFRLLFNSSFLNKEYSEKLLSIMAKSEFNDGLRGGVPAEIPIAHKFGERFLDNGEKQLHDCGIVYYPGNAYQLCVMTKGKDYIKLEAIIQQISKEVYNEFDSRKIAK